MNYLVDTNIFLEILLGQAGRKKCEAFLLGEKGAAWISDFTLHSIGVLLFRQKRERGGVPCNLTSRIAERGPEVRVSARAQGVGEVRSRFW